MQKRRFKFWLISIWILLVLGGLACMGYPMATDGILAAGGLKLFVPGCLMVFIGAGRLLLILLKNPNK